MELEGTSTFTEESLDTMTSKLPLQNDHLILLNSVSIHLRIAIDEFLNLAALARLSFLRRWWTIFKTAL